MKHALIPFLATLLMICIPAGTEAHTRSGIDKWITSTFAEGKTPPFSFTYGGRESSSFIRKWKYSITRTGTPGEIRYTVTYTDPATGLRVDCDITGYEDFDAVDWVLHFKNCGKGNSPAIEKVNALDYSLRSERKGCFLLEHIKGSEAKFDDFTPYRDTLACDSTFVFSPARGRSSDGMAAPFFKISSPDEKGIVLAIGWTGTWTASFRGDGGKEVSMRSGMKNLNTYLYPGESIRTPLISVMFWEGAGEMTGNNKFRRFMLAHNIRNANGQNSCCPTFAGIGWSDPAPLTVRTGITAEIAICNIHRFQQLDLHPDAYWMDAGWYTRNAVHNSQMNWHYTSGTWRPDPERFPDGLRPIADEAHKAGAKFLVWFEPERANMYSDVWKMHPEWLLAKPGDDFYHLFDFGNEEARKWMCSYIGDFIEESGIDFYRQDLCLEPAIYWKSNDEPGRTGMKELRHIEGLYAFLDYLIERFPNILIDNCASGGRRLDIEMYRRSIPLWRTDFFNENRYEGSQSHAYGLNLFLPVHALSMNSIDDYSFISSIGSVAIFNAPLFNNPKLNLEDYWKKAALYKDIQPYFYEDYYPLSGIGNKASNEIWLAMQMHRPSDGSGLVLAFRRKDAAEARYEVELEALEPGTQYEVTDILRETATIHSGAELSEGFEITLPNAPSAVLLRYSKVTGKK